MKFSIIIPVFNVAQYLCDCLDSVLDQTFPDFEAICVNDGSTDNSLEILEEYQKKDPRIKVICQENQGLSGARNTGIKAAQGEYLFFLDSDDWLAKNALEILSNNINVQDLLCFSGQRYFEDTREFDKADVLPNESGISGWEYYNRHALEHRNFAFVCVVLRTYRRQYLIDNNLSFERGIYHEDNMFTPLACYYAKSVKVIPDVLYFYRVRGKSITTTKSLKHKQDKVYIANTLAQRFRDKDIEKTILYRSLTHHYQSVMNNVSQEEVKELSKLVDWKLYRMVSRTKLRHRFNYAVIRLMPYYFQKLNK